MAVPVAEPVRAKVEAIVEAVRAPLGERAPARVEVELGAHAGRGFDRGSTASHGGDRGRDVRWVRLDGIHLTLRFLGPTLDSQLDAVSEAVRSVAAEARRFRIRLAGAGGFPNAERPRALWLGVTEGRAELEQLARALDRRLEPLGWPPEERPFKAHLTLARADGVPGAREAVAALVRASSGLDATWEAAELVLFESHTGHGPARYEPLVEAALGA